MGRGVEDWRGEEVEAWRVCSETWLIPVTTIFFYLAIFT